MTKTTDSVFQLRVHDPEKLPSPPHHGQPKLQQVSGAVHTCMSLKKGQKMVHKGAVVANFDFVPTICIACLVVLQSVDWGVHGNWSCCVLICQLESPDEVSFAGSQLDAPLDTQVWIFLRAFLEIKSMLAAAFCVT